MYEDEKEFINEIIQVCKKYKKYFSSSCSHALDGACEQYLEIYDLEDESELQLIKESWQN